MKLRLGVPRSLFARNVVLLVVLVTLSQVFALGALLHFVQRPRIERAAATFAASVLLLDRLMNAEPPDARARYDALLGGRTDAPPAIDPTATDLAGFYRTYQQQIFFDWLRDHLPADMRVRLERGGDTRLWVKLHLAGEPYWVPLPLPEHGRGDEIATALALSLALAALATLTAYLIQRRINRPLRTLASAARHVSAGVLPDPLPADGPTEIADVSLAFNRMTRALKDAEDHRALMLASLSHDMRTPLTKLRLAMAMSLPSGTHDDFVEAAESYLDRFESILQQFMDYAGSGEKETLEPLDLNALIEGLAGDFTGLGHPFELSLGTLPPVPLRPVSTMRMLMNLMQNAVLYGRTGLSARTWVEKRHVCIAIGDRGKGLAPEELERLKEPFRRGSNARDNPSGTGLGLAIVDRIARLHGGTFELRPREGGGLEAIVRLPSA
ncbi:ATP-binding protein [Pararobbsia silviterrae]|uniref:histidine kinase n=1 Tax=Pararobbsia silviterrae TaxID=1792498 RepID=A0A494Y6J0_9BURK|nr:ATP-binding protein [Pararobbsia silviterrae]RKP55936.1 HAMP domain-containing protein [Pararobbsia silviterrae]